MFVEEQGTPEDSQGFFFLAAKTSCPSGENPFPHSQLQSRKNLSLKTCKVRSHLPEHRALRLPRPKHAPASTAVWHSAPKQRGRVATLSQSSILFGAAAVQTCHLQGHARMQWKRRGLGQSQRSQPRATQDEYPCPSQQKVTVCSSRQPGKKHPRVSYYSAKPHLTFIRISSTACKSNESKPCVLICS